MPSGSPPPLVDDDLKVGAIGVRGKHLAAARTEKEQTGVVVFAAGFHNSDLEVLTGHDLLLFLFYFSFWQTVE